MLLAILMAQALSCAHPQTQTDITQCAGEAQARADVAMNAQWKLTLAAMHKRDKDAAGDPPVDNQPSYADALLAAQRAWLQFRDTECHLEGYAARGGTLESTLHADCVRRLTSERTKQLVAIVKGLD